MKKLLLLSCGTNACFHIAKILKQKFPKDFYMVGCDINKKWLIPTSEYLDNFFQCPYSTDGDYYSFILDICRNEKIDWLLPSFDNDQFLFSCDNEDLQKQGVKSFGISNRLGFYHDKERTNEYLDSIGIPVPKSFTKKKIVNEDEYFVKPKNGVGSVGIKKRKGSDIKHIDSSDCIIQELCFEPEYTLECFLYNQKIYSVTRERIASKSGVCTKAFVFQNKELEKYAYRLAENAELPHIFNMQFMKNKKGDYVCTDLNLRPASGMGLSYTAGWDEISALAHVMLGSDEKTIVSSVDKKVPKQYVVRHYEDSVTRTVKNRIALDLDGTLLDSRKRHEIVMSAVLKNHNIVLNTSDLVSYKSNGHNNMDWLLSKGVSDCVAKKINSEWISLVEDAEFLKTDELYPNVVDVLKKFSKENDLFLVTARNNKENVRKQLKQIGIAHYFENVEVVDACRDTPALKAAELQKHNVDCFIGDTESDYEAALIAGCDFKAVNCGFRNEEFWESKNMKSCRNIGCTIPLFDNIGKLAVSMGGGNHRVIFAKPSFFFWARGAVA